MELYQLALATAILVVLAVLATLIGRGCKFFRFPGNAWPSRPLNAISPIGWLAILGAFLVPYGCTWLVATFLKQGGWLGFQESGARSGPEWAARLMLTEMFLLIFLLLAFLALYSWLVQKITRRSIFSWLWSGDAFGRDVGVGASSYLVAAPVAFGFGALIALIFTLFVGPFPLQQAPVEVMKLLAGFPALFAALAALNILIVPLLEEWLFRGFLHMGLRRYMNRHLALMCSAFVFAAFHINAMQGWSNGPVLGVIFVLGWFLGFVYERQRTLWAPYSLHAVFNGISILLIFLAERYSVT